MKEAVGCWMLDRPKSGNKDKEKWRRRGGVDSSPMVAIAAPCRGREVYTHKYSADDVDVVECHNFSPGDFVRWCKIPLPQNHQQERQ